MDNTYLKELVRNMTPLWDQTEKDYRNRDLKPKPSEEIGKKLNVAGKYSNNNTYLYTYNIGTFYIRMVNVVKYLLFTNFTHNEMFHNVVLQ